MDMNHIGQFGEGGVFAHQDANLLDDIGRMGTIGVGSEDLTSRRCKEFEHTLGFIHGKGLAIGTPEGLLADVGDGLFLQLILRRANTGSLGFCEDGSRHDVEKFTI